MEPRGQSPEQIALNLMGDADAVVFGAIPRPAWMQGLVGPLVYSVIARSLSRYRAIRTLLAAGYQDEALIVSRSLITDAARLDYMRAHPDTRESNGLWWWTAQVKELHRLGLAMARVDPEEGASVGATVDLLRRELLKRQAEAGIGRLIPMPAEGRGMALALERPVDEIDYILATHPTHSTLRLPDPALQHRTRWHDHLRRRNP